MSIPYTVTHKFPDTLKIDLSAPGDRAVAVLQTTLDRIEKELTVMSQRVTDFAAQEQQTLAAISAKIDEVKVGVVKLDELIEKLQGDTSDGATLDDVSAASKALLSKVSAINTDVPGATPVTGGPGTGSGTPPATDAGGPNAAPGTDPNGAPLPAI